MPHRTAGAVRIRPEDQIERAPAGRGDRAKALAGA
jgi:hypothetical protein